MIEDLERLGLIRRLPLDTGRVRDALLLARRDTEVARMMLDTNSDWAFAIAYNAVLQAGRGLMFSKGYRPEGASQHVAVVRFCEIYIEKDDAIFFDRMRRKRNASVYDVSGSISGSEAQRAVARAEELVARIERIIAKG